MKIILVDEKNTIEVGINQQGLVTLLRVDGDPKHHYESKNNPELKLRIGRYGWARIYEKMGAPVPEIVDALIYMYINAWPDHAGRELDYMVEVLGGYEPADFDPKDEDKVLSIIKKEYPGFIHEPYGYLE